MSDLYYLYVMSCEVCNGHYYIYIRHCIWCKFSTCNYCVNHEYSLISIEDRYIFMCSSNCLLKYMIYWSTSM